MAIKNPFCHERLKGRTKNQKISLPPTKTNVRENKNKNTHIKSLRQKCTRKKHVDLCLIFYIFNVIWKKKRVLIIMKILFTVKRKNMHKMSKMFVFFKILKSNFSSYISDMNATNFYEIVETTRKE